VIKVWEGIGENVIFGCFPMLIAAVLVLVVQV